MFGTWWNPGSQPLGAPPPDVLQYAVRSVPYLPANSWLNNYKVNPAPWGNGNMPGSAPYTPTTVGGQPLASGYQFPTYSGGSSGSTFLGTGLVKPMPGGTSGGSSPTYFEGPTSGIGGGGYGNDIAVPGSGGTVPSEQGGVFTRPPYHAITDPNWRLTSNQPIGGGMAVGGSLQGSTPGINQAIQGLLTQGLIPDVARQSAEVAAGRGVAGSGAGDSTAVRMSEQDYLTRLGLANTLASGEAGRTLPYQITPYQQALLALQQEQLQNQRDLGLNRAIVNQTRGVGGGGRGGYGGGGYGGGVSGSPSSNPFGLFGASGGTSGVSNLISGGGGGQPLTLDDIYEELGFGNFGSLPGDTTQPPDFSYDMWD